jgi:hypothetical protein
MISLKEMPKVPSQTGAAKKPRQPARRKAQAPAMPRKPAACVVCGAEVAPFSTEELCWVCRRLKISAWRDIEGQAVIQE